MAADTTCPVDVLREHTTELEAALTVCLADPGHKPVHRLRTETRRIEAQLLLLAEIPTIPEHRKQAEGMRRALRRIRRAAGELRDFDVQGKLLERFTTRAAANGASPAEDATPMAQPRGKGSPGQASRSPTRELLAANPIEGANVGSGPARRALQKGAAELSGKLEKRRDRAAGKLQKLLRKHQKPVADAGQALLGALEPAEDLALPAPALLEYAEAILWRSGVLADAAGQPTKRAGRDTNGSGPLAHDQPAPGHGAGTHSESGVEALDEQELHDLRKAAKAARYLAETLPGNPVLGAAAHRFEALQNAGGQWHDDLDLTRAARRLLGKSHELTVTLAAERDAHLAAYREALAASAGRGKANGSKRARSKRDLHKDAGPITRTPGNGRRHRTS